MRRVQIWWSASACAAPKRMQAASNAATRADVRQLVRSKLSVGCFSQAFLAGRQGHAGRNAILRRVSLPKGLGSTVPREPPRWWTPEFRSKFRLRVFEG